MDVILEALHHSFEDTWAMIPLMFVAYLIIEHFERKPSSDDSMFWNLQKYGPLFGALLGLLPQCGFSILAAMLFVQKNITLGTMTAVFIACSDEAIPVLISEPSMLPSLGVLLVCKFVIAVAAGWIIDHLLFPKQDIRWFSDMPEQEEEDEIEEDDQDMASCPCCYPQYPIWASAALRTLKIYLYVFLTAFVLSLILEFIPEAQLESVLLTGTWWQPLVAAVFGFIPNCAATVVLCELFASGALSFASLLAGLVTNAGLGLVVLFQYSEKKKTVWIEMGLLIAAALIAGYLAMFIEMLL